MRRLRTCPLGQLQGNGQSCFPYLPREQHAKLTASAAVTDVTGHASPRSSFFGRETAMKSRPSPSQTSAARMRHPGTSAGQRRIIYSGMLACGKWCGQALMEWSLPAVGPTGKRPIIVSRICGVKQRAKLMTSAGVTDARGGS
jgi:hypothetical protein